ncbi:MAG: glycoside hydrolase family 127 protein, partial [Prevotellaceae bacterium]|nr:glycoside hydrolase family 127 protein [Prevotellaceae bacterium]
KTIEGAAYSLVSAPNAALDSCLDSLINIVAQGQEPDGYLTTWRTIDPQNPPAPWVNGGGRWSDLGSSHELYNSGHLFEAAAAHFDATGKRNFLDIALKNADLLVNVFGNDTTYEVPGHEIVETGLIKLYRITGNKSYLELSRKFVDLRGDSTHRKIRGEYSQDHVPVAMQSEVVGHAVRAVYLYAAIADLAAITRDSAYHKAARSLWSNMTGKKMYLTGGLGARHSGESFGRNYELPNLTAYSETCAAIGGVCWGERMFRLTGEAHYYDAVERMLYNALIAGMSLRGTEFFYPNPLEADGNYAFNQGACTRQPWFDCSCCPTNLIRFIPSLPSLLYATQGSNVYVNLFAASKANVSLKAGKICLVQETDYPWSGRINIGLQVDKPQTFALKIRIPAWATNDTSPDALYVYLDSVREPYSILLNGQPLQASVDKGYATITREWQSGDQLTLTLPMQPRRVAAIPNVDADSGLLAIERGPLVYCAEEADNPQVEQLTISSPNGYVVEAQPELLGGIYAIKNSRSTLIPYYAWSNRGAGKMKVWLGRE